MSDHLFGSITLPPYLRQIVDVHCLSLDRGSGSASLCDGWRAFLRRLLAIGPMALLSSGLEHLEHFGDQARLAIDELMQSPWPEVVSLGLAMQSIQSDQSPAGGNRRPGQPTWLTDIEQRRAVQARARHDPPGSGATPWILEVDFGLPTTSCINVWVNPNGSLYQLYSSDEPIAELQEFLVDMNHLVPNRPFVPVPPGEALRALRQPAEHPGTALSDRAMLQWLRRTVPISSPK